jgi:glycolate oxidase
LADVYELLTRELGRERVLRAPEALEVYAQDESRLGVFPPDAAVLCESRAEIELVLRLAAEHRIPVTPRGAGSGMTGGALAIRGGIVLSTERMRRVVDINVHDRVAVVEPGVINGDLQAAVEAHGVVLRALIPPASGSVRWAATSPKTRAARARSNTASRATGRWACVTTLMGGETLRLGRRTPKGVTGYDLTALFVAARGPFGVTSEITVRLVGRPRASGTFIAVMPTRCRGPRGQRDHPQGTPAARAGADGQAVESTTCARRRRTPSPPTRARSCWSSWTAIRRDRGGGAGVRRPCARRRGRAT